MHRNSKPQRHTMGTYAVFSVDDTSKQTPRKKAQMCGYQRQEVEEGELGEGHPQVQMSSYEMTCRNVMCSLTNIIICCVLHRKVVKGINPKSFHQMEKNFETFKICICWR